MYVHVQVVLMRTIVALSTSKVAVALCVSSAFNGPTSLINLLPTPSLDASSYF